MIEAGSAASLKGLEIGLAPDRQQIGEGSEPLSACQLITVRKSGEVTRDGNANLST